MLASICRNFHFLLMTKKCSQNTIKLDILGDGQELPRLKNLACELGIEGDVTFHGRKSQAECARQISKSDALVLPSLHECGGAVVLEAMAMGKAVIATNWGGPADYLDDTCGILVNPSGRQELIHGFAEAMSKLTNEPSLKDSLGKAGKEKVESEVCTNYMILQQLFTLHSSHVSKLRNPASTAMGAG